MINLLDLHTNSLVGIGVLSLLTFFGTLLLLPILVARIPADYFVRDRTEQPEQTNKSIVRFLVSRVLRNALGLLFIVAGIVMLFTPGQGLLSILVGVTLTDFPGKVRLGRRLVQQPAVFKAISWIRKKSNVAPLQMPE